MGLFPHTNLGTDKCLNMQRWCTFNVLLVVRISHIHIFISWSLNPEGHFCGNYSSHWKTWFVQFMFDIIWAIDALTIFSGLVTTLNMRWIKLRNFKVDVGWNHQMLQGLNHRGQYNIHTLYCVKRRYQINTSIVASVSSYVWPGWKWDLISIVVLFP